MTPTLWAVGARGSTRAARVLGLLFPTALTVAMAQPVAEAAESWPDALAKMPLRGQVPELNRTNWVEIMLGAFESNPIVKGLVFMPGATDEFYLFRRATARLTNSAPTLLDAVSALTNQTNIRVTFRPPLLLLHTDEDPLEPDEQVQDPKTAERLRRTSFAPHLACNDRDWDYLQPILKRWLSIRLRPWRHSTDSWHFYRHSFAAWGLSGLEALETAALAGKSKFVIRRNEAVFNVDQRVRARPNFDIHLH
jgi:hypothetical protein